MPNRVGLTLKLESLPRHRLAIDHHRPERRAGAQRTCHRQNAEPTEC
jgi:hypothetical protein